MRVRNVFRSQISYLCAALGGFEQIVNDKGESVNTYVVGFECLGTLISIDMYCYLANLINIYLQQDV